MPVDGQAHAVADAGARARAVAATFFSEPRIEGSILDFGCIAPRFLADLAVSAGNGGGGPSPSGGRTLLPDGYRWKDRDTGLQRIPVPLCEYLAYKAALVYEKQGVIAVNLGRATDLAYFDSTRSTRVADTQACGFVDDGMICIVLRGTEGGKAGKADWATNLEDGFTDRLQGVDQSEIARLVKRHGQGVTGIVARAAERPGQHLGFTIGWGAVHDEIVAWLGGLPRGMPVVMAGHSLGGALAQIGASELARLGHPVAAVVTFGAPAVGNKVFNDAYEALGLTEKTVRFEAAGDSVPRIMRRWYYRLDRNAREMLARWLVADDRPRTDVNYLMVGQPLTFDQSPPLSAGEVTSAIAAVLQARATKAREDEERRRKQAQQSRQADERSRGGETGPSAGGGEREPAASPKSGQQGDGRLVLYIFGGIALFVFLVFLWVFVRSKLASHAISERYALYLSTLSYQRIRSLYADAAEPAETRLKAANEDLTRYLAFVRGDGGGDARGTYFRDQKLDKLPVRLSPEWDLETFASDPRHMV